MLSGSTRVKLNSKLQFRLTTAEKEGSASSSGTSGVRGRCYGEPARLREAEVVRLRERGAIGVIYCYIVFLYLHNITL